METGDQEGLDIPVTNLKGLVTRSSSDILNIGDMLHRYGKGLQGSMAVGLTSGCRG